MGSKNTAATRLTTKGQVVIPKSIRGTLGWRAGTRLRVTSDGNVVTLRAAQRSAGAMWLSEMAGCVHNGDPVGDLEAEHLREVQADARRRT
jgi:AbrB family looped-hinge helix DNA binding protein